jgi:hypothetical protein
MAKKADKFPGQLYVAIGHDGDDQWFNANEEVENCINDDGPTAVAEYKLVRVKKLRKVVEKMD